ncbi:hypothetical protein CPB85DRAFT_395418 [Mucidula mucida]|nr:hypothetical protein CPB85DRAFT_395418 [Mucidula mucida]
MRKFFLMFFKVRSSCPRLSFKAEGWIAVHRWIYDYPRIMHRDLSHGNIMWHVRKSRICGVLNDFDLSSSRDASSKQRTGTLPFMAHELHRLDINGDPPIHLYRHDLESIFYIIVLLTCANALKKKPGKDGSYLHAIESSPYHSWFSMTDEQLFYKKYQMMLYNRRSIPVPDNSFKDFAFWIRRLHKSFGQGMNNRTLWQLAADDEDDEDSDDEDSDNEDFNEEDLNEDDEDEDNKNHEDMDVGDKSPALVAFDEETMDGAVSYEAILTIMKTFGKDGRGEKRQLDMMYPVAKED